MEKITDSILKFLKLDNLVSNLTGYVEARIALMKSEIQEDVSKAIGRGIVMVGLFFMGFLFLIFFSIGLAQLLGSILGVGYLGYWIVAGVYAVIFLLLYVFRNKIYDKFENQLAEIMKAKKK